MTHLTLVFIAAIGMGILLALFSGTVAILNKITKGAVKDKITNMFTD